jgi:hypothetical protein
MVTISELRATVERMEQRYAAATDPTIQSLMQAYRQLTPRFRADLQDERDYLLSCGAALMLIQQVARQGAAPHRG